MRDMGMNVGVIKAGNANMFLSPLFRQTLADSTGTTIELFNTDGAAGAARGAGMGAGIYKSNNEAFASLERLFEITPNKDNVHKYEEIYYRWKKHL